MMRSQQVVPDEQRRAEPRQRRGIINEMNVPANELNQLLGHKAIQVHEF
ncbi:hypothetical protein ACFL45_10845 [Candidatus Neomarinimicrobiota bacterium]